LVAPGSPAATVAGRQANAPPSPGALHWARVGCRPLLARTGEPKVPVIEPGGVTVRFPSLSAAFNRRLRGLNRHHPPPPGLPPGFQLARQPRSCKRGGPRAELEGPSPQRHSLAGCSSISFLALPAHHPSRRPTWQPCPRRSPCIHLVLYRSPRHASHWHSRVDRCRSRACSGRFEVRLHTRLPMRFERQSSICVMMLLSRV
jgi:hypothetical protein